jgi:hypothetical protein
MRNQEIAGLVASAVLFWTAGSSGPFSPASRGRSHSLFDIQLAQEETTGGGDSAGVMVSGAVAVQSFELANAACTDKSAGEPCSFTGPDNQTVTGTCTTVPDAVVCVPEGATLHYETGGNASQRQDGDR